MQEENTAIPELHTERQSLISHNEELKGQVNEAIETNKTLMNDLKLKDDQLQKFKFIDKENIDLLSQNKLLSLSAENLKNDVTKQVEEISELKKELANIKLQNSKFSDTISNLEGEIASIRSQLQSKEKDHQKLIADLNSKLRDANSEVEKKQKKIEELKTIKETYTKQTTFTALENQKLSKELAAQFKLLEQYRLTIEQLNRDAKTREEEPLVMMSEERKSQGQSGGDDEEERSLFDDLSEQPLDPTPLSPSPSFSLSSPEPSQSSSSSSNNQIDYFFLAATAVKISLAIKGPMNEASHKVNIRELYDKALSHDVPFHEWYEWIVNELTSKNEEGQLSLSSFAAANNPKLSSPALQSKLPPHLSSPQIVHVNTNNNTNNNTTANGKAPPYTSMSQSTKPPAKPVKKSLFW